MDTLNQTVDALCRGESILLVPDIAYMDESPKAGKMYSGFVHLAKLYRIRTGKELSFYPTYTSREHRMIWVADAVVPNPDVSFHKDKLRMVNDIRDQFNEMAQRCGDI